MVDLLTCNDEWLLSLSTSTEALMENLVYFDNSLKKPLDFRKESSFLGEELVK